MLQPAFIRENPWLITSMYSVAFYGQMLADVTRTDAYAAALRQTVTPDSVVMDLGSGPGVFALLACSLGARRVYAVEPDDVISLARELAAANELADRIEFFESLSTEITVPERADVIVSDLRGVLPWFQQHLPSIIDARERLLAPTGILIPQRDLLWATVVDAADLYEEIAGPWQDKRFEFDLSAGMRFVTNRWQKARIRREQLLVEPICWSTIDYYKVESPDVCAEISWRAARSGTAHGIAVWFDSELVDGIGFSNRPGAPEMIYGQGFFPFSRPVEIIEGGRIKLRLEARMVHHDYVWRWDTDFFPQADDTRPQTSLKQSTFYGVPLSKSKLQKLDQASLLL
jgi:protein arginine N-methyltransferase 1